ncbi:MAG: hypothetical protein GC145_15675 [Caulobacter sp.]|nr:hypothetical protein [Caulobacter sp.]
MTDDRKPLYLNQSTAEDLTRLDGVTSEIAAAIVAGRPYRSWSELERVDGLDNAKIDSLKGAVADLGEPSSGPIGEAGSGGSPGANLGRA